MASLPETDVEEDHMDVGLTISNNEYPLQIEDRSMWRTVDVRVGDLRSSDMRKDKGKARCC